MTSDKVFKWDGSVEWLSQNGHGFGPKLGLVTVWYKACSAAVPCAPWSRTMSHSLGRVVWVAILAARDVLWCWLASLRQAFQSDSRINFLIPCRSWELLSAFKTRSVAPWQSSLFSSDRHSSTTLRDRGSAIVRNVYMQQPIDSPSVLTLERRISFWVRILAVTEGDLRATLVARVEWDLESFRTLLPISLWKAPRWLSWESVSIQFSLPISRTGTKHVSKMVLPEGLVCLPLPHRRRRPLWLSWWHRQQLWWLRDPMTTNIQGTSHSHSGGVIGQQGCRQVLKKESSVCIEFCNRHQFSAPYRRIGRIQVSTTEQPDKVKRFFLKRCPYFHRQTKDFLAFMMLWSIDSLSKRSWFHK